LDKDAIIAPSVGLQKKSSAGTITRGVRKVLGDESMKERLVDPAR